MRHRKIGRSFSRTWSHRKAMFRNLVTALLDHEQIVTTEAKAKELRRVADKMITLGKRGSLHARRQAAAFLHGPLVLRKLFDELAARFQDRPGGYTRIIKLGPRRGDNAPLAMIELVVRGEAKAAKAPAPAEKKKAPPKPAPKPPEKKAEKKPEKKAAKKPEKKPEKKSAKKPDQKKEKAPAKKAGKKPDKGKKTDKKK